VDVETAREQVLDHLDDETGARYAPVRAGVRDWSRVHRKLASAREQCLDDYVAAGGDRFDAVISSSTTQGVADLSSATIRHIRGVLVRPGSGLAPYPVLEGDKLVRGLPDRVDRDLSIVAVIIAPMAAAPLAGDDLVGERSWQAFDEWVCARAAVQLGTKDPERRTALGAVVADLERSVLRRSRTPAVLPWPARAPQALSSLASLRWLWEQDEEELRLVVGGP
jgi:hypothetical protein